MLAVKDAYQTTTGNIAVRDEKGNVWVLEKDRLGASMSCDEQLEKAVDLFVKGTMDAFERYNERRHGLLHV